MRLWIYYFYSFFFSLMKMMALCGLQSPLNTASECQAKGCNFTWLLVFSHEAMLPLETLGLAAYQWNPVLERVNLCVYGVPGGIWTLCQCGSCLPLELHLFSRHLSIYRFPETHWWWGSTKCSEENVPDCRLPGCLGGAMSINPSGVLVFTIFIPRRVHWV